VICIVLQVALGRAEIVLGAEASARNVKVVSHHQQQEGGCALHHP